MRGDKSEKEQSIISILTLGDGDFTYSLDFARYLTTLAKASSNTGQRIHLTVSGIDTRDELVQKYKDGDFVIDQLLKCQSSRLGISVEHSVNAILSTQSSNTKENKLGKMDHVMFHHPHLATENPLLHSRFLCHFFHSCVHAWMSDNKSSFVHLTLVKGQVERWKCLEAAARHGLFLIKRVEFFPPPIENASYHYRRHQTGKSFDSRTSGSETLVFCRRKDSTLRSEELSANGIFSWVLFGEVSGGHTLLASQRKDTGKQEVSLSCPHCDREFKEQRSLKCHIRDRHTDGPQKRAKLEKNLPECLECRSEKGEARVFTSEKALKDHQRAKHTALHKDVLPDWCKKATGEANEDSKAKRETYEQEGGFMCEICGATTKGNMVQHLDDFRPKPSSLTYSCDLCGKFFREARAKLQHENFCIKQK